MRLRRILVIVIAVIIVVPVGAGALLVATFDPNSYKPELIKAAERASGRQVTISGDLHLSLALTPTVSASGITIDNPPGYPDAVMATLERVRAQVALLPLLAHRLDILNLTLLRPQITLERNAAGRGNWVFGGQGGQGDQGGQAAGSTGSTTGTGTATGTASAPAPRRMPRIALKSVSIEHATITYKGVQQPGEPPAITTVSIPRLTGRAETLASPIAIHADARYDGAKLTVTGTTGPFARFAGGGGSQPWPVDLLAEAKGAKLAVQGTIADPRAMRGADVAMRADIPDVSALDPFAGGAALPPLRNVTLTGKVAEPKRGGLPAITDVKLDAGSADLGAWRKGLDLASLTASMRSLEAPVRLDLAGHYQGGPLDLSGTVGPVRPMLAALTGATAAAPPPAKGDAGASGKGGHGRPTPGKDGQAQVAPQKVAVNLTGHVAGGTVSVSGAVATPATLSGVALKFDAQMPDLGKLSDLAGMRLPAITNLGLSFMLTDPGGRGLRHAVGVSSLAATADQFQIGGAGQLAFGTVPDLQAVVRAPRVNLTALETAMPAPARPAGGTGGAAQPARAAQPQGQAAPAASGAGSQRLIPATAIPFGLLHELDANVELTISQLVYDGQNYDAIVAHALLNKGRLTVRPISAQLPGGQVSGTLTANAAASPPSVQMTESAPSFHLGSLLSLLGRPGAGSGKVQVFADLSGAGNTPREIAGTLAGRLGIAMVDGEIDGALLHQVLGGAVGAAGLPASAIGAQGPVSVPCFATRLDAQGGIATLRAFTLDSSRLFLTGTGRVDLGAERLDLVLDPRVDLGGGQSAPVPVAIRGSLADPKAGPASPQDYAETAGAIARQFGGQHAQGLLGEFARKLGLSRPPPGPQSCSGALALARMGHGGPQPSASAMRGTPAPSAAGNQGGGGGSGPQNLLNSLFH